MANHHPRFLIAGTLAALLASGYAQAQQLPSLDSAIATATRWAAQADAGQADAMWKSSGPMMQKSVSSADWAKYLDGVKKQLGATQSRDWVQLGRVENPQGLPPGEYLNVVFVARHATAPAVETVSLSQAGTNWVPVGYIVRPVQQQPAAPAPAAAPAAPAKPGK
ncbi:DUF4019 domain-containing protein [Dyella sp. LX-66]|uniref:DUF4019 domain-containing protein n=1 Tax=unclassified Dyella TaxID=2634549 RepID=UPI001BDF811C|nr:MULTISPECIES: DUF4019 domain-containing protein [unclassified Dyella]MBT2119782.1 DUF4019 domain-containing protein [Dyella sp. LX-1]MBT2142209.1 DUF4019 domain-containing protein [Dyella sp. LX-66]